MNDTTVSADRDRRAAVHAALGDPHRLAVVDALALSDRSPSDLARALGIESNLLAHHLEVLERVGLVERVVSAGDRRRRYLRLRAETLDAIETPAATLAARSVLFVCTANSARSQLAAALWNAASSTPAESAGTHPADRVHPRTVATAARHGLDLAAARPRALDAVRRAPDLVVTVCDRAHEQFAVHPAAGADVAAGGPTTLHWSIEDPVRAGTAAAFERAYQALRRRVAALAPVVSGAERSRRAPRRASSAGA